MVLGFLYPVQKSRDRGQRWEGIGLIHHQGDPSGQGTLAAGLPVLLVGFLSSSHMHMHIDPARETDISRAVQGLIGPPTGPLMYNRALPYADILDTPVRELNIFQDQV
jgi:hypothetical protein